MQTIHIFHAFYLRIIIFLTNVSYFAFQRKDVLILIKYSKCKVPGKLMGKTFLDWTDNGVQPHFWLRLYEAIGPPGNFKQNDEAPEIIAIEDQGYQNNIQDQSPVETTNDIVNDNDEKNDEKKKLVRMTSDYSSGTSDYGESEEVFTNDNTQDDKRESDINVSLGRGRDTVDRLAQRSRISTGGSGVSCTSETQALLT